MGIIVVFNSDDIKCEDKKIYLIYNSGSRCKMTILMEFLGKMQMSIAAYYNVREKRKQIMTTKLPKRDVLQHFHSTDMMQNTDKIYFRHNNDRQTKRHHRCII